MPTPLRAPLGAVLLTALASGAAGAQPLPANADALAELRDMLRRQAATLEDQGREIAALRSRLDQLTAEPRPADASPVVTQAAAAPAAPAQPSIEEQRRPEMPAKVVSAGEFPGSIGIPGSDAAFKLGGQVRMTLVHTFAPLGTDDRFITSSIPAEGTEAAFEGERTRYIPTPSRLNVDLRSHTPIGPLRTFVEADFSGSGNTLKLRHAYAQGQRWLVGQTWSTFSDPEAEPHGIDFEGLNAITLFRQAQARYSVPLGTRVTLALAAEDPTPELTGASGVNLTPDAIVRLRWEPEKPTGRGLLYRAAHVQTAFLIRQLRGSVTSDPQDPLSTVGWGANVSGVLVPRWDAEDRVKFAANVGKGYGRYIKDLQALGGQDAVYDPGRDALRALPVATGYIGYERLWRPTVSSSVTYGLVGVDNLDVQASGSLRRTQRASINVSWTPIPALDVVVEFLAGSRLNNDGTRGTSSQLQGGWTFRF
jgi:hypothetical protein